MDQTAQPTPGGNPEAIQEALDLSKASKVLIDGKEMTSEEIRKSMMLHKDYTQKTQALAKEREQAQAQAAQYKTYLNSLDADLQHIARDPSLISQFKSIYPPEFHKFVAHLEQQGGHQQQVPQWVTDQLAKQTKYIEQKETEIAVQNLDKTLAKFSAKYPDAIEAEVLNVGAALAETKGGNLTEEDWDKIYKMSSKKMSDILKARESERIKKAREARQRGADTGSGGGTPGTAPKKETLKQAFERAQKELTGQKF